MASKAAGNRRVATRNCELRTRDGPLHQFRCTLQILVKYPHPAVEMLKSQQLPSILPSTLWIKSNEKAGRVGRFTLRIGHTGNIGSEKNPLAERSSPGDFFLLPIRKERPGAVAGNRANSIRAIPSSMRFFTTIVVKHHNICSRVLLQSGPKRRNYGEISTRSSDARFAHNSLIQLDISSFLQKPSVFFGTPTASTPLFSNLLAADALACRLPDSGDDSVGPFSQSYT